MNSDGGELHLVQQLVEILGSLYFGCEDDYLVVCQLHQNIEKSFVLHLLFHVDVELLETIQCEVLLLVDLDDVIGLFIKLLS